MEKKSDKESLKSELEQFLATPHGKIDSAVKDISDALTNLLQKENAKNQQILANTIKTAMLVPKEEYFRLADPEIKSAMLNILEHAKAFLTNQIQDLTALNEQIKQEKQRLKKRIQEIEQPSDKRKRLK